MSHKYKTYEQRLKEVENNQKRESLVFSNMDENFLYSAITKFIENDFTPSIDVNTYVKRIKGNYVESTEEIIMLIIGHVKFISQNTFDYIFGNENYNSRKFADALQRLQTKGYIYNTKIRYNAKSLYGLTAKGKEYFKKIVGEKAILPFSEYNYNTDGNVFHDTVFGNVFLHFLVYGNIPFIFSRNYFQKGTRNKDDVYMDAILLLFPWTNHKKYLFVEGDTGTEGFKCIVEKIGKYYAQGYCKADNRNQTMFVYRKNDFSYFNDVYSGIFISKDTMISYLNIINFMKKDREVIDFYHDCECYANLIKEDIKNVYRHKELFNLEDFLQNFNLEGVKFLEYEVIKFLLFFRTLMYVEKNNYTGRYIQEAIIDDKCDYSEGDIVEFLGYFRITNRIEHIINCMHNIEDTKQRKISLVKAMIKNMNKVSEIDYFPEALESIYSGVETIFVPETICEAYLPYYMDQSNIFYQNTIKEILEKIFKNKMAYAQCGTAFKSADNFPDLNMRNCYYFIRDNHSVEIYVENISASLSAMVRVIILINNLNGIITKDRDYYIVCLVDSKRESTLFHKLISNPERFNKPVPRLFYLTYDSEYFRR